MKKIFLLAVSTLSITSCNNNVENYPDEPVEAHITASISHDNPSRASESSWAKGDVIGVYMEGRYFNMKYTTPEGDGNFEGTKMYFKNKVEPVTLTAYYPFDGMEGTVLAAIETSTTAEKQTPEQQTHFDFLYAVKENVVGTNPEVAFDFAHKMSKITLIFKNGNGMDVGRITSYEIAGLILDGTFTTTTGDCKAKEVDPATMSFALAGSEVKDGEALPSLIVFPQAAADEAVTLKITDNENQEYSCTLDFKDNKLQSGNNYQFKITVNKTGLVVGTSNITGWNDVEAVEKDAN